MTVQLFGIYFHILELIFIIYLLIFLPFRVLQSGFSVELVEKRYFYFMIGLFALYITTVHLSVINAIDPGLVYKSVLKWLEIFGVTILVFFYISDVKKFKHIFWFLIIFNFSQVALVYIQILLGYQSLLAYRIFPSYQSVLAYSLILPVCLKDKSKTTCFLVILTLVAILLSLSRGNYISATIITLFTLYKFRYPLRRFIYFLIPVLVTIIFTIRFNSTLFSRISLFFSMDLASNRERFTLLLLGIKTFLNNPLVGIGSLNFPAYYEKTGIPFGTQTDRFQLPNPHNTFIQIAAEEGAFALLFFCALIILIYHILNIHSKRYPVEELYVQGLKNFFIAFFITLFLGFFAFQNRINFAILCGIATSMFRLNRNGLR